MSPDEAVARTIEILARALPDLINFGTSIVKDAATQVLYDIVANKMTQIGESNTLTEFSKNPTDQSLTRRILTQAAKDDPQFLTRLTTALKNLPSASSAGSRIALHNSPNSTANTGNIASGKKSIAGQGISYKSGNRSYGGLVVAGVAVLVVFIVVVLGATKIIIEREEGGSGAELTAASTCEEFLKVDQQTQLTAINSIGLELHVPGIGSPLALPSISYSCSQRPERLLGDVVSKFNG
jgi:hypothetical protein